MLGWTSLSLYSVEAGGWMRAVRDVVVVDAGEWSVTDRFSFLSNLRLDYILSYHT